MISAGIYGYPKKEALDIATSTIKEFLKYNEMDIYLVVFNRKVVELSEELYENIKHYIDCFYEDENYAPRNIKNLEMEEVFEANCYSKQIIHDEKSFNKESLESILDNMDEIKDLLSRAGYSLSLSNKFDLIIEYFIKNENYDIFIINEALFSFEQPLL